MLLSPTSMYYVIGNLDAKECQFKDWQWNITASIYLSFSAAVSSIVEIPWKLEIHIIFTNLILF